MEEIARQWVRNEATRLAEVFAGLRAKYGIVRTNIAWLMERDDSAARLVGDNRFPIADWTYFDADSDRYCAPKNSPPEFVSAFLASEFRVSFSDSPEALKRTTAQGLTRCVATVSGHPVPDIWRWRFICQINGFEADFPIERCLKLVEAHAESSPNVRELLLLPNFASHVCCPTIWFLVLAYLSEYQLIPREGYCRTQLFAVREEGQWLTHCHFPEEGSWDLVTHSRERSAAGFRPKYQVTNGRVWVGSGWQDFFRVCEMGCLWIASAPRESAVASNQYGNEIAVSEFRSGVQHAADAADETPARGGQSPADLKGICDLAQECVLKGNSLIRTAATSPRVEEFCGENMQVDELPGEIFAFIKFMDDIATRLNSVRRFYSETVARVVQIDDLQGLCFHAIAWDFAYRIWGHIKTLVFSVWACNPVGEDPVMHGFRFLIDREAILSNLEEIRTALKGLKPIQDTKRFRLELQAEFLQGLKIQPARSSQNHSQFLGTDLIPDHLSQTEQSADHQSTQSRSHNDSCVPIEGLTRGDLKNFNRWLGEKNARTLGAKGIREAIDLLKADGKSFGPRDVSICCKVLEAFELATPRRNKGKQTGVANVAEQMIREWKLNGDWFDDNR